MDNMNHVKAIVQFSVMQLKRVKIPNAQYGCGGRRQDVEKSDTVTETVTNLYLQYLEL